MILLLLFIVVIMIVIAMYIHMHACIRVCVCALAYSYERDIAFNIQTYSGNMLDNVEGCLHNFRVPHLLR